MHPLSCRFLLSLCFVSLTQTLVKAQEKYPTDYFDSPIRIPLSTSGVFGEIRSDHFHSGIDFRINGRSGEPIYAPADGYVSRIKVSATGGGKALYIDHPNGFRSVYFHLDTYEGEIADYVKQLQYRKKTFEFDTPVKAGSLAVKKGNLVARGGNTGSSGGPHLHYEIRYVRNDQIINPLLFGLKLKDNIPPQIKQIKIYAADSLPIPGSHLVLAELYSLQTQKVRLKNGRFKSLTFIKTKDTIQAWGKIYFGVEAVDKSEQSTPHGFPSMKIFIDGELFYSHDLETFRFDQTRNVNAIIDYPAYKINRKVIYLSRILPGNKIDRSRQVQNQGYFQLEEGSTYRILCEVADFSGNQTRQEFFIQTTKGAEKIPPKREILDSFSYIPVFYNKSTSVMESDFQLLFERGTFFENFVLRYRRDTLPQGEFANRYLLAQEELIPINKPFILRIQPKKGLSDEIKKKLLIIRLEKGLELAQGGEWKNGLLEASLKTLGTYTLQLDTLPPEGSPSNFQDNKKLKTQTIQFRIRDNLSGIESYTVYLNEEWILTEYDAKTDRLSADVSTKLLPGKNSLKLELCDRLGNRSSTNYTIFY